LVRHHVAGVLRQNLEQPAWLCWELYASSAHRDCARCQIDDQHLRCRRSDRQAGRSGFDAGRAHLLTPPTV